jgi:PEGA domain
MTTSPSWPPRYGDYTTRSLSTQDAPAQSPSRPGRLVVDTSFPSGALFLNGTGPRITIDGVEHEPAWGPSSFDLPPGDHRLRVSSRYFGDTCPAETTVTVAAGQETRVFYKAAMTIFSRGAIGSQPQSPPGMAGFAAMMLVTFAIPFGFLITTMNGS